MTMELNTSRLKQTAGSALERYDVFMLRRHPLVQGVWNRLTMKRAARQLEELRALYGSVEEMLEGFSQAKPDHRLNYWADPEFRENEISVFQPLVDKLDADLKGESLIDIGPGFGSIMDLAHDKGASHTGFVDIDPAFFLFNELKGHKGYLANFIKGPGLELVKPDTYDFVICRGALIADRYNNGEPGILSIHETIDQLEAIWSGRGAIIVTPTFYKGDDPDRYYWCQDEAGFPNSVFAKAFSIRGYATTYLDGYNSEGTFPFTFTKGIEF